MEACDLTSLMTHGTRIKHMKPMSTASGIMQHKTWIKSTCVSCCPSYSPGRISATIKKQPVFIWGQCHFEWFLNIDWIRKTTPVWSWIKYIRTSHGTNPCGSNVTILGRTNNWDEIECKPVSRLTCATPSNISMATSKVQLSYRKQNLKMSLYRWHFRN